MNKRLYFAEVTKSVFVVAESCEEAKRVAEQQINDDTSEASAYVSGRPEDYAEEGDLDCMPLERGKGMGFTIGEWLAWQDAMTEKE